MQNVLNYRASSDSHVDIFWPFINQIPWWRKIRVRDIHVDPGAIGLRSSLQRAWYFQFATLRRSLFLKKGKCLVKKEQPFKKSINEIIFKIDCGGKCHRCLRINTRNLYFHRTAPMQETAMKQTTEIMIDVDWSFSQRQMSISDVFWILFEI